MTELDPITVHEEGVSSRRLDVFADRVATFWGVSMPVVVAEGGPATDWSVVHMPEEWQEMPDTEVLGLVLHEWGHRTLAPGSVAQALWWEILARLAGISASHEAVNLATDLLIDRFYLTHPLWRETYEPFLMQETYTLLRFLAGGARDSLGDLLVACYLDVLRSGGVARAAPQHPECGLAREANAALFDERRTLDERMRGFFEVVAPAFGSIRSGRHRPGDGNGPHHRSKGSGSGRSMALVGRPCPWRAAKWDAGELVRFLVSSGVNLPEQVLDEVCGARGPQVRARLRVAWSLSRVERPVARLQSRLTRDRQENTAQWRVGDSMRALDPVRSIERSGQLIPGVTTLRRLHSKAAKDTSGLDLLWVIVDNSGSTSGAIIETILDAAVGLLEAARRLHVPVGLLVFGFSVVAEVGVGRDYDHIATVLASLEGQSGGTQLAPALRAALRGTERARGRVASVVFTDSFIFDVSESLPSLKALSARGPTVLFCVAERLDEELVAAVAGLAIKPRVVQCLPGQPLVELTLEVFEG